MRQLRFFLAVCIVALFVSTGTAMAEDACVECHRTISPGQVRDWEASAHSEVEVTCSTCHGETHTKAEDAALAAMPSEAVCGDCHEDQLNQFARGKHNLGWVSMNAMPVTHLEPDELMEGGRGCGGCHNMGIKTEAQKKEQLEKGHRYQTNSCDECHTRHTFSVDEARHPRACQQCHMGYDHPQWEMWSSSKHGTRWFAKQDGALPEGAAAPTCQDCHMKDGDHENRTAWGFLGVRLPLPEDPQWAADRVLILKALGVLNPETGEPTARLDAVKAADLARLDQESWQKERDKMIDTCAECHSKSYGKKQLDLGDQMMQKADRLMGQAIEIVAALYKDGIIEKKDGYAFAYPDFLYFMRTGGGDLKQATYVEQVLFEMYMKHRMRTYQAFFHVNPDYAYWYGWAMMTKDLVEIQDLAETMRATHRKSG